jgi:hypothetical protein
MDLCGFGNIHKAPKQAVTGRAKPRVGGAVVCAACVICEQSSLPAFWQPAKMGGAPGPYRGARKLIRPARQVKRQMSKVKNGIPLAARFGLVDVSQRGLRRAFCERSHLCGELRARWRVAACAKSGWNCERMWKRIG